MRLRQYLESFSVFVFYRSTSDHSCGAFLILSPFGFLTTGEAHVYDNFGTPSKTAHYPSNSTSDPRKSFGWIKAIGSPSTFFWLLVPSRLMPFVVRRSIAASKLSAVSEK